MSDDLRQQFLSMLGDAPVGGNVTPDAPAPQSQTPQSDRMDRIEAALERMAQPPTVASIVNSPNPRPVSDYGGPGMTATIDSDSQPAWKWSQEKVDALIREKGMRGFAADMKSRLFRDLRGQRFHFDK